MLAKLIILLALAAAAAADTITSYYNLTYVTANPDGKYNRHAIGINNAWPLPIIEGNKGDQLIVHVTNLLDRDATFHLHGQYQNGTSHMDGASMVSQCPIPPNATMTYNITLSEKGTHWYHCHVDYCYPDGYRQAMIIHDPDDPYADQYDEERLITLSDWYHTPVENLQFMSLYNPTGAEPIPDAFLLNDGLHRQLYVQPNTTYLLRLVNVGGFVSQYFSIANHTMTIVEVEGTYTKPAETDLLYIGVGQRYAVLLHTKNETDANYAITTVAEWAMLDTIPSSLQLNNTHWLVYNNDSALPESVITVATSDDLNPYDDINLVPRDEMALLPEPDVVVNLTIYFKNLMNGHNYGMFGKIAYTSPKVPTLYTALSAGNYSSNEVVYGTYTHPVVLKHMDVVEVVVNNADTGTHLMYLHGHSFQLIARDPPFGPRFYAYKDYDDAVPYDPSNHTAFPASPVRRDVGVVPPMGYMVYRFVADNPGVWLFHCQVDWHLAAGLGMTFVEAPDLLPTRQSAVPDDHYTVCAAAAVPSVGNAAANTVNYLDLTGQNKPPKAIPGGFTGRGIAAMFFTVLSAVLGIIALIFYGLADIRYRPVVAPKDVLALGFAGLSGASGVSGASGTNGANGANGTNGLGAFELVQHETPKGAH